MISKEQLLTGIPPARAIGPEEVQQAREGVARPLVVLDDDPTGTQSVAELPVLNAWGTDDLAWALGTGAAAVYVMTNSRSLAPDAAAQRNREVVRASLTAAERLGIRALKRQSSSAESSSSVIITCNRSIRLPVSPEVRFELSSAM